MPYVPVAPLAGTMTQAAIEAELTAARDDWLNGNVTLADVKSGAVRAEHLAPPEVFGAPVNGFRGETGNLYAESRIRDSTRMMPFFGGTVPQDRCNKTDRFDIFLAQLGPQKRTPIPGMMKRLDVWTTGRIVVRAQWSAVTVTDAAGAGPPAQYNNFGYFIVARQRRESGSGSALGYTEVPSTTRRLWYLLDQVQQQFSVMAYIAEATYTGVYDVCVAYNKTGANAGTAGNPMVSIGYRNLTVDFEPD